MTDVKQLITEHLDIWLTAEMEKKSGRGRSSSDTIYGVQKLRELILDLAISGKIVTNSSLHAENLIKNIISVRDEKILNQNLKTKASDSIDVKDKKYIVTPNNWAWIRLGNVAKFIDYRGKTPKKIEVGVPLITAKNVRFGFIDEEPREFISELDYHEWMTRGFPENGDLLFTTEAPLGNIAEITLDYKFALAQRVICFQLHEPKISKFLKLLIMSNKFQTKLSDESTGMTATGIKASKLKEIAIPIPPLEEQHRIVEKVDELMQLCDQLEQQQTLSSDAHATLVDTLLKALTESSNADEFQGNWQRIVANFDLLFTTEYSIEQLKQTVLQLAVMSKLVKQDPSDEPASELLKKIADEKAKLIKDGKIKKSKPLPEITEDEKPFELPNGWEFVWKKEIFNFLNGYAFKSEWFDKNQRGMKLLRNINISHGFINWDEAVFLKEDLIPDFKNFALEENDIVLTLDRPLISTGLKYAILRKEDLPCYLLQRVAKFQAFKKQTIFVKYLELWINSKFFISNIDQGRSNGVPHISTAQVEKMVFALPPFNEQKRIVEKVNQLFSMIDQLQVLQSKLQKTKLHLADALVANAVQGV